MREFGCLVESHDDVTQECDDCELDPRLFGLVQLEPALRVRMAQRAHDENGTFDVDWNHFALNLDVNVSPCRTITDAFHNVCKRTHVGLGDDANGFLSFVGIDFTHEVLHGLDPAVLHVHEARTVRNGDVKVDIISRLPVCL